MANVDAPEIFKSSDISKRLTYQNIQDYFLKEQKPEQEPGKGQEIVTPIDPVIICYANNRQEWEKDINYMYPAAMALSGIALETGSGKHRKEDEDLPGKKKKRNKGLSY